MTADRTRLAEVLRTILLEIEQSTGVAADDPALVALKEIVIRRIADLQFERATEDATPIAPGETPPPIASSGQAPE